MRSPSKSPPSRSPKSRAEFLSISAKKVASYTLVGHHSFTLGLTEQYAFLDNKERNLDIIRTADMKKIGKLDLQEKGA